MESRTYPWTRTDKQVRIIAHIVAAVRGIPIEELAKAVWNNTERLFYSERHA